MIRFKASIIGGLSLFAVGLTLGVSEATQTVNESNSLGLSEWPAWVTQPSQDGHALHGVGIASSREDARLQAQAELILSISNYSFVQQVSQLKQVNGAASADFIQQSIASSLPLELPALQVARHAQLDDLHAVMVSISVTDVIASLQDALTVISRQPPPNLPIDRLIWALQHYTQIKQGLQIERALHSLGAGSESVRSDLLKLVEHAQNALSSSSIRIVAQSDTAPFVEVLTRQFPAGGEELLWLQIEHTQHTGRQESMFAEQRSLRLTLRQSTAPFRVIHQQSLHAHAFANSPQTASKDTEYQLIKQLERPLFNWFFN